MSQSRTIVNCPDKPSATTNCVYVATTDPLCSYEMVECGGFIFNVQGHPQVAQGSVALNTVQRKILRAGAGDPVDLTPFRSPSNVARLAMIYAEVTTVTDRATIGKELAADDLIARLIRVLKGQVFTTKQQLAFEHEGSNFKLIVGNLLIDVDGESREVQRGMLVDTTAFIFTTTSGNPIKVTGQKGFATTQLFKEKQFNFEALGIGGLDKQFEAIFRRAFASRVFPPSIIQKLGIKHVKGMLLFGPPGTGKTLIARQIGKVLNGKEPKVVNGPEVLSKYVGEAEENIRKLFLEAESEYREKGDDSELHIIIFDEIDAICKQRGSVRDGVGVHDTVVNQLLTKIDGVDALNNILVIGMTNRRDMLDEALLRPGRLEVQVEIGLPDEKGRLQILQIHTSKMSTNSYLSRDVQLDKLAELTKNFSGAEIEGLTKDAAAYALNRNVDYNNLHKALDEENIKVTMDDFLHSLEEIKPAFGAATDTLQQYCVHGLVSYGELFDKLKHTLHSLVHQVQSSEKTPLLSCLLEGPSGSGKSALAAKTAMDSEFPYVKVISPENLVGYQEQAKASAITKIFDDAYRSPLSVIIIDDIERLLEYVAIGPRFSNIVLQTMLVLIKKMPPPGRRLFIIGTTSAGEVMESMGLRDVFNVSLHVPSLRVDEIVRVVRSLDVFRVSDIPAAVDDLIRAVSNQVPIKKLLLLLDLARQDLSPGEKIPLARWQTVLDDLS